MSTQSQQREERARRLQKNLVAMGCIAPPDAVKFKLSAEKPAPVDTMDIPDIEVSDEDVLKFGRRVAQLMASDRAKNAKKRVP